MKVLSLFSGIGGFDLGFQRAGMEVVGMCEIDKHAQKILQRRFPDATLHTDVRKVSYERRSIDLICGGFPCQDLSVAGKRRGLDGERSGLWFEFARIIDEAEPAWVVIENVPGLFSSNGGHDFAVIVDWLAQRGYGVGWRVLDAQGFGLAQRRKRVFIVASFGSPRGCTVLLEPEGLQRNPKPSRAPRQGDTGATQVGTRDGIARTITTHEGCTQFYDYSTLLPTWHATTDVSPTLRAEAKQSLMTGDVNINAGLAIGINGQHGQWTPLFEQSHALSTTKVEQVASCIGVRRLTPTECERLQGFPDGWTDGQADTQRYKQLGNAVAVPVAEWIGRRIMEVKR
jgi:DNA (cytosine-5)-methyltransferase 1